MVHTFLMTHDNPQLQKTVLVVGCLDSPVPSAVSTVLSSWRLEYARDNQEALALVEKSTFDLVITDQGSPGREDAEMLQKVRLVTPQTRLIIVTDRSTRRRNCRDPRGSFQLFYKTAFDTGSGRGVATGDGQPCLGKGN